ncbi:MAG: 4Fe-4S binding protein [Acidobacteriota bacterium]|jgi:ferredoxin|nr:4Fe-4S binding protein [Acidobacteriota bacterium]
MALTVTSLRTVTQYLSFIVFMYGGRFGVKLGSAIPCFACPYVRGCGGQCYLMGLQGVFGVGMSFEAMRGAPLAAALGWLLVFIILVAALGKTWCGWLCPFGLFQDWFSLLRRKLGVRERILTEKTKRALAPIKYILLAYLLVLPPLVTAKILHQDFNLPFCNICPGKSLLPLFEGNPQYLALNLSNAVTLTFSALLLIVTGVMLIGIFFKDRFFCVFCPLLALIHLAKPLTFLRLSKNVDVCTGCGNCRRVCIMDIAEVSAERGGPDVQTGECLDCARCAESCTANGALSLKWLRFNLFSSSRLYASRNLSRNTAGASKNAGSAGKS